MTGRLALTLLLALVYGLAATPGGPARPAPLRGPAHPAALTAAALRGPALSAALRGPALSAALRGPAIPAALTAAALRGPALSAALRGPAIPAAVPELMVAPAGAGPVVADRTTAVPALRETSAGRPGDRARTAAATDRVPAAPVVYRPPVAGALRVLRPFDPPVTPYGPGHLGVDLRASGDVLAAADGVVTFAGQVAGRGVVVVSHADGIRTEYEPVHPSVRAGVTVRAGQVIGVLSGTHPGCPRACLHWGARRGSQYLDPLSLLRPLGPVRLLPWTPD